MARTKASAIADARQKEIEERFKGTARKTIAKSPAKAKAKPATPPANSAEKKTTAKAGKPKAEKKAQTKSAAGKTTSAKKPTNTAKPPKWDGDWEVNIPGVDREWDQFFGPYKWSFFKHERSVWATFDAGIVSGGLKLDANKASTTFHWRGRENSEGSLMTDFGSQTGKITLVSPKEIKGIIQGCYGDFEFTAKRLNATTSDHSGVYEWEQCNDSNYEHERVARWR